MSPYIPCTLSWSPSSLSHPEVRARDARLGSFAAGTSALFEGFLRPLRLLRAATPRPRTASPAAPLPTPECSAPRPGAVRRGAIAR